MLHLPSERIAELADADDAWAPQELEHLVACDTCTRELEAHRRLVAMAGDERLRIAPPLSDWGALRGALHTEGLLRTAETTVPVPSPRGGAHVGVLHLFRRAAAVLVLVGGGAILGRMSTGMRPEQAIALGGAFGGAGEVAPDSALDAGAQLVADTDNFASPQAALASLERAQRTYEAAAMYLATHDTTSSAQALDQYRTRLAALDRTAETMQEALREAPQDPYINQYYLATMNAREQTIRRLGTVMPVGNRLGRF